MRLLMYGDEGGAHLGALQGDRVVDLRALAAQDGGEALPADLLGLIDAGDEGLRRVESLLERLDASSNQPPVRRLADVQVLPPLDRWSDMLDVIQLTPDLYDWRRFDGEGFEPVPWQGQTGFYEYMSRAGHGANRDQRPGRLSRWPAHCSTPRYALHGPTASRYWWAMILEIWCRCVKS